MNEIKQISINKEKNSNQGITYDNIIKLPAIEKNKNKHANDGVVCQENNYEEEPDFKKLKMFQQLFVVVLKVSVIP